MSLKVEIKKTLKDFSLNLSFEVQNEVAVLFGPSGSGKSMTLNSIAGLFTPDEGKIALGEKVFFEGVKKQLSPQKRRLGYIFQNHSLFPHMTVEENILFGGRGLDSAKRLEKCYEFLKKFNLLDLALKMPYEISGGQAQRVALARALIGEPQALLLDEPFSALDTPTRVSIGQCLSDVFRELQIPVIFVTHDIYEACAMADKMIVLHDGKILQMGTPQEVYQHPSDELVHKLVRLDRHLEFRR